MASAQPRTCSIARTLDIVGEKWALLAIREVFLGDRRFDEMVRRITAPTLLVQGDRDRLVAAAASRRLAGLRPEWSFELFTDTGHVPQLEQPARFVGSVERWLARRAPAAATR